MPRELLEPVELTLIRRYGAEHQCDAAEETEGAWPHAAEATLHGDYVEGQLDLCAYHLFRWLFDQGHREIALTVVP